MNRIHVKKSLAVGIILLFVGIAANPITETSNNRDDTISPLTTISLNPSEPDGENDWYISPITVTLNATDNESGVNRTEYQLDVGAWQTYKHPFNITVDGHHKLNYRSIDNAGNREPAKNVSFKIDHTKPQVLLSYNITGDSWSGEVCIFAAKTEDAMSGMNRTEFYINDELYETVIGPGPLYESIYHFYYPDRFNVRGFILNPEFTDEYVKLYCLLVCIYVVGKYLPSLIPRVYAYDNAGNMEWDEIENPSHPAINEPGIYLFQTIELPHNYTGYIGKYFIHAIFYYSLGEII